MMRGVFYPIFLIFVLLAVPGGRILAAEANNSPYDVVYNHVHYLKKQSYDELQSAESFNIRNKKKRIEAAIQLKEIFDGKGVSMDGLLNKIPDNAEYIDSASRRPIYIIYNKLPQVYVEKIGNKWYYSQTTVDALPALYKDVFPFGANIWAKWFPMQRDEVYLRLHPWQWIGIGVILLAFLACNFLLRYLFRFVFNKILFRKYVVDPKRLENLKRVSNIFSVWVGVKVLQLLVPTLFISAKYSVPLIKGIAFVGATLLVISVYKLTELILFYLRSYTEDSASLWDDQIVVVLQKFFKFIVGFLGLFYILNTLDVNIATIIAGLSVGGLALALAAQDTVKNFIASVMIFIDKPFRIGDLIKGDNFEGTVQEVGFRSTRIKTASDSVVYVANAKLSEMIIDNKGQRILKKNNSELVIPHGTPLPVVKTFIEGIRRLLTKYPSVRNNSIDVYLTKMDANGMVVKVIFVYKVYTLREEMQHGEVLLMKIMELAELLHIKLFDHTAVVMNVQPQEAVVPSPTDMQQTVDRFIADYEKSLQEKSK